MKPQEISKTIHTFIFGKYVVIFQWIEAKIDEIFCFGRGQENREATLKWLSKKKLFEKINEIQELVVSGEVFREVSIDNWCEGFNFFIKKMHDERKRRNDLLHSKFLLDFLELGEPVMKNNLVRGVGNTVVKSEPLSPEKCDAMLTDLAELAYSMNQIYAQLVHVYDQSKCTNN